MHANTVVVLRCMLTLWLCYDAC